MRGDSGVAGEGRVAVISKFHSWGKYTMPLTHMEKFWVVLDIVLIVLIVENVINSISHLTNLLEK